MILSLIRDYVEELWAKMKWMNTEQNVKNQNRGFISPQEIQ
jgi:hypothetical protein